MNSCLLDTLLQKAPLYSSLPLKTRWNKNKTKTICQFPYGSQSKTGSSPASGKRPSSADTCVIPAKLLPRIGVTDSHQVFNVFFATIPISFKLRVRNAMNHKSYKWIRLFTASHQFSRMVVTFNGPPSWFSRLKSNLGRVKKCLWGRGIRIQGAGVSS